MFIKTKKISVEHFDLSNVKIKLKLYAKYVSILFHFLVTSFSFETIRSFGILTKQSNMQAAGENNWNFGTI